MIGYGLLKLIHECCWNKSLNPKFQKLNDMYYLGAFQYSHPATKLKMILGIQAASIGEKLPLVAKVIENLSMITKRAAITSPIARSRPLPPRTLRVEITAPIIVKMTTENGVASR